VVDDLDFLEHLDQMVRLVNVLAVTTSLAVPATAYLLLVNRRLERRIPLVTADKLPKTITRSFSVPGKPKLNYVEAYYADLPASKWSRSTTKTKVEDVARVFWTTLPMKAEWTLLSFLQAVGLVDESKRIDPRSKDAAPFTKGKGIMDGVFLVEKGVEDPKAEEIMFSYWQGKSAAPLSGGVHQLACEPLDGGKTVRVWFVTHIALDSPAAKLVADEKSRDTDTSKYLGHDPVIVDPSKPGQPLYNTTFGFFLWLHRFYSRVLLDFKAREIMSRN
jgi:hypothetical protein